MKTARQPRIPSPIKIGEAIRAAAHQHLNLHGFSELEIRKAVRCSDIHHICLSVNFDYSLYYLSDADLKSYAAFYSSPDFRVIPIPEDGLWKNERNPFGTSMNFLVCTV